MDYLDVTSFKLNFYQRLLKETIKYKKCESTPYIERCYFLDSKKTKIEFGIKNISKNTKNEQWSYYYEDRTIDDLDELISLLK